MSGKLQKLRALSRAEQQVLLKAALLLPVAWGAVRLFGLRRLHRWATRPPARDFPEYQDPDPQTLGKLIAVAANHLPLPSTCLTRSLLLLWLLGRRGLRAELRIGVKRVGSGIESHAWVEIAGMPVNDAPGVADRFTVFDAPLSSAPGAFR